MIQPYLDFRERYQAPIWMGESGENKDEWIAQFREMLEKNDVGWTFWPYGEDAGRHLFAGKLRAPYALGRDRGLCGADPAAPAKLRRR